jgi:pSer/pThr/pTyr-binding forkhead associated (FHA) protein
MPYIILTANGEELDRRDLTGPLTIGRAVECDVRIHDILMSRHHCRIEPDKGKWRVVDLGSKNGTHFNWTRIGESHVLFDGDALRVGRTTLVFRNAPFVPSRVKPRIGKLVRPADPHEALTGTISDFVVIEPEGEDQEFDAAPSPRNRPAGPSEMTATIGSVLNEISSSWDSIVATVSKPRSRMRPMASPNPVAAAARTARKQIEPDLSLQAAARHLPFLEIVSQPTKKKRRGSVMPWVAAAMGIALATLVVLFSGWAMMQG